MLSLTVSFFCFGQSLLRGFLHTSERFCQVRHDCYHSLISARHVHVSRLCAYVWVVQRRCFALRVTMHSSACSVMRQAKIWA